MMRVHAVVGLEDQEGVVGLAVPTREDALFQELVRTQQPLTIADAQRDERFRGLGGTEWVRSWLGVPLLSKGQVIGLLTIDSGEPGFYTAERAELAFAFGQQASMAIENARLFEETQRRAVQLAVASEVARDAIATLDVDQLLDETVRLISERFGFYHAGVFLVDEERGYAVLRAASSEGGQRMLERGHRLEVGRAGMVGYVTDTGEPRIALDVGQDAAHFVNPDLPETRSEMTLPLLVRGEVIGALDVQSTDEAAFTDEDVAVLQTMADQLANAIANARLFAEIEQTAERLKELDRLKSQFLANMSHELTDLQAIYESGQHLLGLINDILDISKIEAGKMELVIEDVDLREIIKGVMSTAIALVKDKPIKLQQTIAPDLPTVRGDVRRIREIFLNLVANAAKFTEEGFIHLTAEATLAEVVIAVSDSGIGIPADKMDIIFEPFTQVDASSTRRAGGTGLGLSISKHFVEMHDGRIWVESTPGEGSAFYFTLPIEPLPPALVEEKPKKVLQIPKMKPGQKLVLCVDDDEGVITLFRRYLGKQGYQVAGLTDGIAVVEYARQLQPFAITLDVLMPNKDGWQIIQELKTDPETRHIPVIMCTIMSEEERGLSLGASDYLVKPILEQDLLAALERLDRQAGHHRVLVVDDQAEDRSLLRRMIEACEGYEVVEAAGGQEAIDLIRQVWPHVIILDLMMPKVDGFAVLETVKADETTRSIPIIVVTAKDLSQEERDTLDSRVETWLQKGLHDQQELLADVAAALKRLE
jgi:signal transduction histidine kinase/CheY-like chemotaxis protein